MKFRILLVLITFVIAGYSAQAYNQLSVDVTRAISKDIFDLNGKPFLNPMVKAVNVSSNAGFINKAFVPKQVDKPYFRVSVIGMYGMVPDDMKSYQPEFPMEKYDTQTALNLLAGGDTTAMLTYFLKNILYTAIVEDKQQEVPGSSATVLGGKSGNLNLNMDALQSAAEKHPLYAVLPEDQKTQLLGMLTGLPDFFTLPQGANLNTIGMAVPQVEIGSLYGTELLIRFIPPVNYGETIGDFAFWGFGLKHSISQYFGDKPAFDLAVQGVYQGTKLENTVGVTNSEISADATFLNFNIQASKSIEDWFDIYSGVSFENVNIDIDFLYYLSIETQGELGLVEKAVDENGKEYYKDPDPENGYPGDTKPQKSVTKLDDFNVKWVIGLHRSFGDFSINVDYSLSDFNIFSANLSYKF